MSSEHRSLLEAAKHLYERHEQGQQRGREVEHQAFNLFSVLCKPHDEGMHDRFLTALLDYRQPADGKRRNLEDFLDQVVGLENFDHRDAKVERQRYLIDILIHNPATKQAVVIENKIYAEDQPKQLRRYHESMQSDGYAQPHLLYLTLDGREPSADSAGDLPVDCVSYREHIPNWLNSCLQRSDVDLGLRESIHQYLYLIEDLAGRSLSEDYMKELTDLCLRDDNFALVSDLNEAVTELALDWLSLLWLSIERELSKRDIPRKTKTKWDVAPNRIKRIYQGNEGGDFGLYYGFGTGALLAVESNRRKTFLGVKTDEKRYKNTEDYRRDHEALKRKLGGTGNSGWWPYQELLRPINPRDANRQQLKQLASEAYRREYAEQVADKVSEVWIRIGEAGLS
ncbi:MAG: hypothetical protein F4X31_00720 [Gammaproteobacteria bacterium]|nr:hypothetical protein [Gammaproteobacteria bacterium]